MIKLLVLVGPSASGKSAIVKHLEKEYGIKKFVTCTTRPIRVGEVDGVDYYFFDKEEFLTRYNNCEFIETVFYNGNYYGTLKSEVDIKKVVILEPQGLNKFIDNINNVFAVYLETDEEYRIKRMVGRGDASLDIMKRIENDRVLFGKEQLSRIDYTINTTHLSVEEITRLIFIHYQAFCREINS